MVFRKALEQNKYNSVVCGMLISTGNIPTATRSTKFCTNVNGHWPTRHAAKLQELKDCCAWKHTAALLADNFAAGAVLRMLREKDDLLPKILEYIRDRFSTVDLMFCLQSRKYAVGSRIPDLPIGAIASFMASSCSWVRSDALNPRESSLIAAWKSNPDFVRSGNHSIPS